MPRTRLALLLATALVLLGFVALRASTRNQGRVIPAASMHVPRSNHSATLLADGRVLIAGGMIENGVFVASAEYFDPAKDEFEQLPEMSTRRVSHGAARLNDGRVLVTGGSSGRKLVAGRWMGEILSSSEIFDPKTGQWSSAAPMTVPRTGHLALPLRDGRVMLLGGMTTGEEPLSSTEVYDPHTGKSSPTAPMSMPRVAFSGVVLQDGRVLVMGGESARGQVVSSAEVYDPAKNKWSAVGSMTVPRYKHAAILLNDGTVLVVGGSDANDWTGQYDSAELFHPATGRFTTVSKMAARRFKLPHALALLANGDVLVGGGSSTVERFDVRSGRFSSVDGSLSEPDYFAQATTLADGRVLITGGYGTGRGHANGPVATRSAWLYQP